MLNGFVIFALRDPFSIQKTSSTNFFLECSAIHLHAHVNQVQLTRFICKGEHAETVSFICHVISIIKRDFVTFFILEGSRKDILVQESLGRIATKDCFREFCKLCIFLQSFFLYRLTSEHRTLLNATKHFTNTANQCIQSIFGLAFLIKFMILFSVFQFNLNFIVSRIRFDIIVGISFFPYIVKLIAFCTDSLFGCAIDNGYIKLHIIIFKCPSCNETKCL